jgi:pyruvate ferredoxin oxidoreductase gamma subunit
MLLFLNKIELISVKQRLEGNKRVKIPTSENVNRGIYGITLHGRGGQGSVTAADLLCEFAYASGYKDTLAIPIIGAERRGSPVKAFARLSMEREIKNYSYVVNPDYVLIFDVTLLPLPGVLDGIKHGTVILNTREDVDLSKFPPAVSVYAVDATGISIDLKLIIAGSPVLNVPMLGAWAKLMGNIKLEMIRENLLDHFGSKGELNFKAAERAYNEVKLLRKGVN